MLFGSWTIPSFVIHFHAPISGYERTNLIEAIPTVLAAAGLEAEVHRSLDQGHDQGPPDLLCHCVLVHDLYQLLGPFQGRLLSFQMDLAKLEIVV